MLTNVEWKGIEYASVENCRIFISDEGAEIHSAIRGGYQGKTYAVDYSIRTNHRWQTIFFDIKCRIDEAFTDMRFEADGNGNWKSNGEDMPQFRECIDIDIPLTPFTNTLPIRRLNLQIGEVAKIKVLYIDLLEGKIEPLYQKYTRVSADEYQYENVPNDFEARIKVDNLGLVVDYPTLFSRVLPVRHP